MGTPSSWEWLYGIAERVAMPKRGDTAGLARRTRRMTQKEVGKNDEIKLDHQMSWRCAGATIIDG
jgi:hypothetical protein